VTNNGLDLGGTASGAYVTFGDPAKLDLTQFTIETWFKRTGTGVTNSTGTSGITNAVPLVTHGAPQADGSNLDANWILAIDDSTDVIAADFEDMATGLNHPVVGTTTITNNVWHHAAATYDGTTWRLYLDGNLEATLAANATPRSDSIQQSGLGAMITSTGSALGRFQGTIDEARVWNRALTLAEIQANINSEVTSGSGLVARWGLNEASGASVSDSVPSSAPGTVNGTNYSWVTGAPFNIFINNPPNTPVLNLPANNATGVSTSPTLDASVSDPDGGNLDVTFYGRPSSELPAPGPDFTIIALPDTQYYTSSLNGGSPAIFNSQTSWIVNNIASRNIVFVTQLGDCTEHGDQYEIEWQNADTAFQTIENPTTTNMTYGMPYGIAPGNHDQSPIGNANGTTTFYNQYFGEARFLGRDYYGGHYGTNNDNHYELFSVSGLDFIVIHLEYDTAANASVLDWADALLKTYSDRRGIVVSHYIINAGFNASFGTQGQAIYTALKDNPNLFLMLSGHVSPPEGQRSDTYQGNTINTLMSDYQGRTNGGNGWLRIMTFSPTNNTVHVQTYSPWLNTYETDADSDFTLTYNMQDSAAPFTVVGTTTVASGSNATVTWSGLTAGTPYEWYATVSDGNGTATSSTNTFTTASIAPTNTPTSTPTDVPTPTPTYTPTDTPTSTPTDTATTVPPTNTLTNTPTDTLVPATNTPTNTLTDTPVPSTSTPTFTPTNTSTNTPTPSGETCKQEGACFVFEYLGYVTDNISGQTTITFRVTNKCRNAVSYVAIGTDNFTRIAPTNGSVYTDSLGTYNVMWTSATGSPGFASIEFLPRFKSFKNGASDVFSIVVTNFDPNVTIQVAGRVGSLPDENFNFLLSQTTCPVGPTATPTNTAPPLATNTPTPTATPKPTKTPRR
jgi:hypothetical protein